MTELERWTVGAVTVTKITEMVTTVPLEGLLRDVPPGAVERHPWLRPAFVTDEGTAVLSIHALVVDTGAATILVDTCIGNDRQTIPELPALQTDFLDRMEAAGYPPDAIDVVLCTHLHFDHVGWNTRLVDGRWEVTFPRARYLFGRAELEHWRTGAEGPASIVDTVLPVIDAGRAELVETDATVADGVRLLPTPGHTPGHVSVLISSEGETAIITGDMAHHPLQFAEPEIGSPADSDGAAAVLTRRRFLDEWAGTPTLVIGTHFATPTAGRIVRAGPLVRFATE